MKKFLFILISLIIFSCQKETFPYKLTIICNPEAAGQFSEKSGYYTEGTNLSVIAEPNSEYEFVNWTGDVESSSNSVNILMDSDKSITANFIKKKYELKIEVEGKGSVFQEIIKPGITDEYNSGTILKLTAVPVDGWVFVEWQGDIQNENNPIEITIDKPISIKAIFKHYPASGLPIVKIKTNQVVGPAMDKDSYVEGSLEIIGDGNFESLEETTMKIKGRGNSTWWICTDAGAGAVVGKCPYQVKFGDKTSVLGMPEDKKWVLLAEKSDKSMIRNKIARYMGELSDLEYTPNAEYIELFINEDYQGTYLIGQKVEESKNRVNIGDEGYLIEIDTDANNRIDPDDIIFKPTIWSSIHKDGVFNIKDPNIEYDSEEFKFIERSGLYFGFIFGLFQMIIWYFFPYFWILPLFGLLVGYATNWLALKLIFQPVEPIKFLGMTFQGLFIKRQNEVSKEYAFMLAHDIFTFDRIFAAIINGPTKDRFVNLIASHANKAIDDGVGISEPVIKLVTGKRKYEKMKNIVIKTIKQQEN